MSDPIEGDEEARVEVQIAAVRETLDSLCRNGLNNDTASALAQEIDGLAGMARAQHPTPEKGAREAGCSCSTGAYNPDCQWPHHAALGRGEELPAWATKIRAALQHPIPEQAPSATDKAEPERVCGAGFYQRDETVKCVLSKGHGGPHSSHLRCGGAKIKPTSIKAEEGER